MTQRFLIRTLTLNGAGVDDNADGNYGSPTEFIYTPENPAEEVEQFAIKMKGGSDFPADEYGNNGNKLNNGIQIEVRSVGQIINDFNSPYYTNWDLVKYANQVQSPNLKESEKYFIVLFDLAPLLRNISGGIQLLQDQNDYIKITLQDNFNDLDFHNFVVYNRIIIGN